MTKPIIKITAILAALILIAGAVFHMSGLAPVKETLADVKPVFYQDALSGIWVMPSVHWILIAFLSVGLSWYKSKACAATLIAFGVLVFVDGLIAVFHIGPFMGAYMLGVAGILLLISGVMLRHQARSDTG